MPTTEGREPPERRLTPRTAGWLLISDVDGTLTGDPSALADLLEAVSGSVSAVLSSSRPVDSVRGTLLGFPGPWMPVGIIGALGTEIELAGRPDYAWNQRFRGWDRRPVDAAMARLGFEPHADEHQTPAKASFAVPEPDRDGVQEALAAAGVDARVFVSGESDFDVVPPGAGKGPAARHAAAVLGFDEGRVVTAGDALIDVEMLEFGCGLLVGNATAEAVAAAGPSVYRAGAPFAAGVLEGLRSVGAVAAGAPR